MLTPSEIKVESKELSSRKDAVHQELSATDSSLKDLLIEDSSGSLFDSISWLLMNSGSLDFTDNGSLDHLSLKCSIDSIDSQCGISVSSFSIADLKADPNIFQDLPPPSVASVQSGGDATTTNAEDDDDDDDEVGSTGHDVDDEISRGNGKKRKRDGNAASTSKGDPSKKKRQRERVEDLEDRVKALHDENAELRSHLKDMTQRTIEMDLQRAEMERLMVEKVSQIGDAEDTEHKDIAALLRRYRDIFSDYGSSRQKEVTFHVNQLKKLLLPTQTTKMCLWTLQQDKSFYQSNKSPLYDILSKELTITSEQTARIQSHRQRILSLLEKLQESLQLTDVLQTAITRKHSVFEEACSKFLNAMSPRQTVAFLLWIEKHNVELSKVIPNFNKKSEPPSSYPGHFVVGGGGGGGSGGSSAQSSGACVDASSGR